MQSHTFFFFSFFTTYMNTSHESVTSVIEFEEGEECGLLQLKITLSLGHDFQQWSYSCIGEGHGGGGVSVCVRACWG